MSLDVEQAVHDVMQLCDRKMKNYEMVSMRSALLEAGYDNQETQQVLEYVASKGFDYCLDSSIRCSSGVASKDPRKREYPSQNVCYWGPDQLKDRLECL